MKNKKTCFNDVLYQRSCHADREKGEVMDIKKFPGGVWPVMLTPFRPDGEVDYEGLRRLTDWYIEKGSKGLFAVCQSSEMFFLEMEERLEIARAVVECAAGRVPVIACGNIADKEAERIEEANLMAQTGVDAVILVTNSFAEAEEGDAVWMERCERFLKEIREDIPLGFYECPYPYKRLISLDNLKKCAETGRFYFLKDTCCDLRLIKQRLTAVNGTKLKIYNANSATLLDSLLCGVHGFSGVMANFHTDLYAYLCSHMKDEGIRLLQDYLTVAAWAECKYYPANAKYFLQKCEKLPVDVYCRKLDGKDMNDTLRSEMEMFCELTGMVKAHYGL
ncbi:4-hydroxy-tetrahydrodipicolinate synthase [Acetatifactor muris]|jgi:4-hydroxy-tetrahydrodipicolinate synthase|uniref:4-hydroxy-tetrahydrodipicolinate synthase n=2 Tax=Acetatifactor muris TaxID=879566 RepID=A0A2K4ZDK8_9FIRM|nr:4-hydroxy-tetrahydrodipicolinate synthase [Acetatifactor muris]